MIFIENNYCVYIHTNKINNKKYIGVTKLDPEQRWKNGMGYKKQSFYNAIMKYGWDNFEHEIIYKNLTAKDASIKEQELIKKFQSNNPNFGYNNTSGGLGVYPKERVNNPLKGRFGEDSNSKTKKVKCLETNDVFDSISDAERWCDSTKVGECCRGIRQHAGHHPETGDLLSWKFADEDDEVTIKCHTLIKNSTNTKFNNGKSKKVYCIETKEIFNSETEACIAYNCARGTIGRACSGKRKTALKKHWKYIE